MLAWTDSSSIELVCHRKWHETADTVSLELKAAAEGMVFDFKPGQFISLGVEIESSMEYRAYSISSLAGQSSLQLTIKRVDGGKVSNFIIDELEVGAKLQVLKPAGGFNSVDCPLGETNQITLVSAGCGITPVMAMAKEWLATEADVQITFVHMARNKQETIYLQELEFLNQEYKNFHLALLLKDNTGTEYPQGRLDQNWLTTLSPRLLESTVYLCGPVGFMQDIEQYLNNVNFAMDNFYQESFTPVISEQPTSEEASADTGVVQVDVPAFGKTVEAESGSLLVDALEKSGVPIIAACRSGICGSCKCKVDKGSVVSSSTETLTAEEIEQGYVLSCSSTIQSDVEVSLG